MQNIISSTQDYNLHAHTQFCDGRDSMAEICAAACESGMKYFGFTPHSPVPVESSCNMAREDVRAYLEECARLKDEYAGRMGVMSSLEIDFLGPDWGPHVDYFCNLDLDYRLGSVHFVPTREGEQVDCDGNFEGFSRNLALKFGGDTRYVVEKYFEQVLTMLERGGLDLLGHFDKIASNASQAYPGLEEEGWYVALVDDVISHAQSTGVVVEINTKAWADKGRFFPAERWWGKLRESGLVIAVDSDAHYAGKVTAGREEAMHRWGALDV